MPGKVIIFSAPSGSGKSTIIGKLMAHGELNLAFSISCTSRQPRGTERDGVEYFFVTPDEFRRRIAEGEFLEYEEVYKDRYYGTLKSQVEKQLESGENVDAPAVIEDRLARASFELTFAPRFDKVIVNDDLDRAVSEAFEAVKEFVNV